MGFWSFLTGSGKDDKLIRAIITAGGDNPDDIDGIKWWGSLSKEERDARIGHHEKTGKWADNLSIDEIKREI